MKNKKLVALLIAVLATATVLGTVAFLTSTTETVKNTFTVGNIVIKLDEAELQDDNRTAVSEDKDTSRVITNKYDNLMPGDSMDKDPTVHVLPGSAEAYLFVKVDVPQAGNLVLSLFKTGELTIDQIQANKDNIPALAQLVADKFVTGLDLTKWEIMNEDELQTALAAYINNIDMSDPQYVEDDATLSFILGYKETVKNDGEKSDECDGAVHITVFEEFKVPGKWDAEELENFDGAVLEITAYAIQKANIDDLAAAYAELFPND